MNWRLAFFTGLTLAGGVLAMRFRQRLDNQGRFMSHRKRWIAIALGIYGLAVLAAIAIAGSKF